MIVFVTKFVQPSLPLRRRRPSAPSRGSLQGPMKAFHLALCLRMSVSAEIKSNALLHQPHRQPCPSGDRFHVPPRRAVIHQHRFRHSTLLKSLFQPLFYRLCLGRPRPLQSDSVTAVIIQYRERSGRCLPSHRPLKIHLPELVRCTPRKSLHRGTMPILGAHQSFPQQNPVNGDYRQMHSRVFQQHAQLPRSPVRPLLPQRQYALLERSRRSLRTVVRPSALLHYRRHPTLVVTPQPQISRGSRYLKLPAQFLHRSFPTARAHHKTHPLLFDVHHSPCHPALSRGPFPSALAAAKCKGCPDNAL